MKRFRKKTGSFWKWLSCRTITILIRLFLSCLPGVKALLHASNTLEENDMNRKALRWRADHWFCDRLPPHIRSCGKICAAGLFSDIRGIQASGHRQKALFPGLRRGPAAGGGQTVHFGSFLKRVTGGIPGTWMQFRRRNQ